MLADADLTHEKLEELVNIIGRDWLDDQLARYSSFRHDYSPSGYWSHRPPSMSPIVPLVYWGASKPYKQTREMPMGYWYGEPLSILGHLSTMILEFKEYWKGLPNNIGLNNVRWFLRTPGRFSGFEFEIRTASTYLNRTRYHVEPKFFDPRCGRGEPDIVMVKENQRFNV